MMRETAKNIFLHHLAPRREIGGQLIASIRTVLRTWQT